MTRFLAFIFALQASSAFAVVQPLVVDVALSERFDDVLEIRYATREIHSSMCGMTNTSVNLTLPVHATMPPAVGEIAVSTRTLPMTICLMAFGPHRGSLSLGIGERLPELTHGDYILRINGETYGQISISQDGVEFYEVETE